METCNLCKKPLSETKFVYHNVPVYNTNVECMCNECAETFMKAIIIDEPFPGYSKENTSNYSTIRKL